MNTQSLNLPEDLGYTARHVWARKDGDTLVIGITDFAQDQLGEILFVDLPDAGASFGADDEFGTVESLKTVSSLYMPVAGEVVERNEALEGKPTLVNLNCYADGWMLRIPAHGNARPDDGGWLPQPAGRLTGIHSDEHKNAGENLPGVFVFSWYRIAHTSSSPTRTSCCHQKSPPIRLVVRTGGLPAASPQFGLIMSEGERLRLATGSALVP